MNNKHKDLFNLNIFSCDLIIAVFFLAIFIIS